jgi:phospholipid/cholesterol/gamma-HCH transport system substrate-binding protein
METRAGYIAVAAFVLILLLGGVGFGVWASKYNGHRVLVDHFVRLEGSVAGLGIGSNVTFGGIPIGKVTHIALDPQDQSRTRVDMTVRADAPIRTDSQAVLTSRSLIGGVVVEISRGSPASPRLTAPEIAAGASSWERLVTGAPKLADKASALADQLNQLLTVQNTAALARILASADRLSSTVGRLSGRADRVFAHAEASGAAMQKAWGEISGDLAEIERNGARLSDDASQAIGELKRAGAGLERTQRSLDSLMAQDKAAFDNFMSVAYPQLGPMFAEMKRVMDRYTRLWAEIRNDPARFFLLDRSRGFQPPG